MKGALCIFLLLHLMIAGIAQDSTLQNKWSMQMGIGTSFYINTLKYSTTPVQNNHFCASFKVMREWEYRIAMGVETGYYTLYTTGIPLSQGNNYGGTATLVTIPVFLHIRMRIVPHLYLVGGTGISILNTYVEDNGNSTSNNQVSYANYQASILYEKHVADRWRFGIEVKFMNVAKTEDYFFGLQLVTSYEF